MSDVEARLTQVRREAEAALERAFWKKPHPTGEAALDSLAAGLKAERAVWERELGEALKRERALYVALGNVLRHYRVHPDQMEGLSYMVPELGHAASLLRGEPGAAP